MDTQSQFTRSAVVSSSFDEKALSIDAIVATATPVMRRDSAGTYAEVLNPSAFRTAGADLPLIDEHQRGSVRTVVGRAANFRLEGGNVVATVTFSTAEDVAPIVQRVRDGTLKHFSIGYRVARFKDETISGQRTRTATDWLISEVSLVGQPADPNAKRIRHMPKEIEDDRLELEGGLGTPMPDEQQQQIRSLAEVAGLTRGWAEDQIDAGATLDDARQAARSSMIERSRAVPRIRVQSPASENPAEILNRRVEALTVRVAGGELSEQARPFVNDRLIDHARAAVERAGISTRMMDTDQIFRAAMHSTSDFPQLLTGVGNRTLLPAYQAAASPLKRIARQATAPDFRPTSRLRTSGTGTLEKVSESGEIKSTSRSENVEGYALDTYASIFSLTRKALINDDLGAFRDWGVAAGRAAANTEANLLYSVLTANGLRGAKLSDGKTLFHADHKNLTASPGQGIKDIGADALNDAKLKIARQTDLDGKTPLSAKGRFILVRPELEDEALRLIADIYPATVADVNVNTARYEVLTDPRIESDDFWLFADPASLPVLEYAYLSSAPGPQLASREGWDVLGTEWRVVLDFGVGAIDFRGAALIADV